MLSKLNDRINRSKSEGGFTLIELLVVIIIIGILLAIAIPSYLKFRDRANKSAAQANVRASIPAIEAYYADNNTYAGATLSYLQTTYDAGVKNIVVQSASPRSIRLIGSSVEAARRSISKPSTWCGLEPR